MRLAILRVCFLTGTMSATLLAGRYDVIDGTSWREVLYGVGFWWAVIYAWLPALVRSAEAGDQTT